MKLGVLHFDELSDSRGVRGARGASQSVQVCHGQHVLGCRPVREVTRLLDIYRLLSNEDSMLLSCDKLVTGSLRDMTRQSHPMSFAKLYIITPFLVNLGSEPDGSYLEGPQSILGANSDV